MKKYTISWKMGPLSGTAQNEAEDIVGAIVNFTSDAIPGVEVVAARVFEPREKKSK